MKNLPKIVKKSKRIGRGYGSGRGGHTVGRGAKGQKARGKIGILFEGIKVKKSLLRRLPLSRGKGKQKSAGKPLIVNLKYLNLLPKDSKVDRALLVERGIIGKDQDSGFGVKILGGGTLSIPLTILLPISKSARAKVEAAGGNVPGSPPPSKKGVKVE